MGGALIPKWVDKVFPQRITPGTRKLWEWLLLHAKSESRKIRLHDIDESHVAAFVEYQIKRGISRHRLQFIEQALIQLQGAISSYAEYNGLDIKRRFDVIMKAAWERSRRNSMSTIPEHMGENKYKVAAAIQLETAVGIPAIRRIEEIQILGLGKSKDGGDTVGLIRLPWKKKSLREFEIKEATYTDLLRVISEGNGTVEIQLKAYRNIAKQAAGRAGVVYNGSVMEMRAFGKESPPADIAQRQFSQR